MGQVEIEHSSKTSLFQETEWENLPRETRTLPDPLGAHSTPRPPAELSNTYLTQMRIGAQRTAFEIHHYTKMQGFIVVTCSIWGEFELNLNIICLRFMTNMINYVTGLAETKKCRLHKTSLSLKIVRQNKLSHGAKKGRKNG